MLWFSVIAEISLLFPRSSAEKRIEDQPKIVVAEDFLRLVQRLQRYCTSVRTRRSVSTIMTWSNCFDKICGTNSLLNRPKDGKMTSSKLVFTYYSYRPNVQTGFLGVLLQSLVQLPWENIGYKWNSPSKLRIWRLEDLSNQLTNCWSFGNNVKSRAS